MATFRQVFSQTRYAAVAIAVAVIVFVLSVWLPNWRLIIEVLYSFNISLFDKLLILTGLLGSIKTNFTFISAGYTIAIAVLFGVEISLLMFYIKNRRGLSVGSGAFTGFGGLVSGIFGIGCAACGTFLLTSILILFGAGWIITFLPLGGEEFGILGVALLAYSIYTISRKIQKPAVCEI